MKPTRRVVVSTATFIRMPVFIWMPALAFVFWGGLSQWLDSVFNNSQIANSEEGFGRVFFYFPSLFGAIFGLFTGLLFLMFDYDRKLMTLISCVLGTIGLCGTITFGFVAWLSHGNSEDTLKVFCIFFGPSSVWMVGLILYALWQVNAKGLRDTLC